MTARAALTLSLTVLNKTSDNDQTTSPPDILVWMTKMNYMKLVNIMKLYIFWCSNDQMRQGTWGGPKPTVKVSRL